MLQSVDYASFLSTLSQITATMLAVFVAAFAAYFVFLQEHESTYADATAKDKSAISDTLRHIWDVWSPNRFNDFGVSVIAARYKARVHKTGLLLVEEALNELRLDDSPLKHTFAGIDSRNTADSNWRAPAFLWAFDSALQAMSGEDKTLKEWAPNGVEDPCHVSGDSDITRCDEAVHSLFPTGRTGIGFEQWRRGFESLFSQLQQVRGVYVGANVSYYASGIGDPNYTDKETVASVDHVYSLLAEVNAKLDDIDRQQESAERYAFANRLQRLPLTASVLLAGATSGLVMPLTLLALGRAPRRAGSVVLLSTTSALMLTGFIAFGYDLFSAGRAADNYVAKRWFEPIKAQLSGQKGELNRGELLNVDLLHDARDNATLSHAIAAALDSYTRTVDAYNASTKRLDTTVVSSIRSVLGPYALIATDASGPNFSMRAAEVLDDQRTDAVLRSFMNSSADEFLSVESDIREPVEIFATDANKRKLHILKLAMHAAKSAALRTGVAASFEQARQNADRENRRLSTALNAL